MTIDLDHTIVPSHDILVVRRNDGVIQLDGHVNPCWNGLSSLRGTRTNLLSIEQNEILRLI